MSGRDPSGSQRYTRLLETVRRLTRREATGNLERLLQRSRAEDLAAIFPSLLQWQRQILLKTLLSDAPRAAEVLAQLGPMEAGPLLAEMDAGQASVLVGEMRADDSADLLAALPEALAQDILRRLRPSDQEEVQELMQYRPTTAGGIMSTDYFALDRERTANEAIIALQQSPDAEMVFYVYCVSDEDRLVGVLSLRDLLRVPGNTPLHRVMSTDVITVRSDMDQEEVARVVERYDLLAVPVVDELGRLQGIVTVDDVIDVLREEANEDILKMAGASGMADAPGTSRIGASLRGRLPSLVASLTGGVASALVVIAFRTSMEKAVLLAAFIPVMLILGGNSGTQAAAVVARGMAADSGDPRQPWRLILREMQIGLPLALLAALLLAGTAMGLSRGSGSLGFIVGLSMSLVMGLSGVVGGLAPSVARRLSLDPAIATGPGLTTVLHLLALLVYLLVARLLLGGV